MIGTVGTRIDGSDVASALTTPEAPDLHALFAVMRERGVEACAMEVSSHALVMGRVDGVVFDVAVFTNLGRDHLDFHTDMEDYFRAKAQLFTPERARLALVNVDDEYGRRLVDRGDDPGAHLLRRAAPDADWRADGRRPRRPAGSTLHGASVPTASGRAPRAAPRRLQRRQRAAARSPRSPTPGSTPQVAADGVAAARCPRPAGAGRRGPAVPRRRRLRAQDRRRRVRPARPARRSPRPAARRARLRRRPRPGQATAHGRGGRPARRHRRPHRRQPPLRGPRCDPRRDARGRRRRAGGAGASRSATGGAAIAAAVALAEPGDTVLVAGKGHEQGQDIAGVVHPFDDREVLREASRRHGLKMSRR